VIGAVVTVVAEALAPLAVSGAVLAAFAALLLRRVSLANAAVLGALLALALLAEAWLQGSPGLLAAAGIVAGTKAVGVPMALRHVVPAEVTRTLAVRAVAGVAAMALAIALTAPGWRVTGPDPGMALAAPLGLALLGLGAMMLRDDLAGQTMGVVALEGGAVIGAAAVPGLPGVALLALGAAALSAACVAVLVRGSMSGGTPP
jgi:hypothetical protein